MSQTDLIARLENAAQDAERFMRRWNESYGSWVLMGNPKKAKRSESFLLKYRQHAADLRAAAAAVRLVGECREALAEIKAAVTTSKGSCGVLGTNWAECDYCGAVSQDRMTPIPHEKGCAFAVSAAALASIADWEGKV